jgi:hypothetical protein
MVSKPIGDDICRHIVVRYEIPWFPLEI